jgi:hypothetical protein
MATEYKNGGNLCIVSSDAEEWPLLRPSKPKACRVKKQPTILKSLTCTQIVRRLTTLIEPGTSSQKLLSIAYKSVGPEGRERFTYCTDHAVLDVVSEHDPPSQHATEWMCEVSRTDKTRPYTFFGRTLFEVVNRAEEGVYLMLFERSQPSISSWTTVARFD